MKKLSIIFFIVSIVIPACSDDETFPEPKVSFYLDNELYESNSPFQNCYSIDNSRTGLKQLGIHISSGEKDVHLFCTTDDLAGIYTYANSIEGEYYNRLTMCDEVDSSLCKSASFCESCDFIFTVQRSNDNPELLEGSFEGILCNQDGAIVSITEGKFINLRLFPD